MRQHIEKLKLENLKQRPEHVRQRIAFGTSVGVTGLIAIVWITTLAASGKLALTGPDTSEPAPELGFSEAREGFDSLVGAVGQTFDPSAPREPELTVVDGGTTSTIAPPPMPRNSGGETVISF
jgi:hypothetical protein